MEHEGQWYCWQHARRLGVPYNPIGCHACASKAKKLEAAEKLAVKWLALEDKQYGAFAEWVKELDELARIIQGKE